MMGSSLSVPFSVTSRDVVSFLFVMLAEGNWQELPASSAVNSPQLCTITGDLNKCVFNHLHMVVFSPLSLILAF
jgi:hypothetical protein